MSDSDIKDAILLEMLPDVPFEGWSRRSLRQAAARLGHDPSEIESLFPAGARDAVAWFGDWADRAMTMALAKKKISALKVRERIALGVRTRLELLEPYPEATRRSLAFLALPANLPLAARLLYRTVDAIWHAAGDRSTDFSFYTKRGLLAGVYASTSLYWLEDRSAGKVASWAFLDRRIAEVLKIPQLRARLTGGLGSLPNPLRLLRRFRQRTV